MQETLIYLATVLPVIFLLIMVYYVDRFREPPRFIVGTFFPLLIYQAGGKFFPAPGSNNEHQRTLYNQFFQKIRGGSFSFEPPAPQKPPGGIGLKLDMLAGSNRDSEHKNVYF